MKHKRPLTAEQWMGKRPAISGTDVPRLTRQISEMPLPSREVQNKALGVNQGPIIIGDTAYLRNDRSCIKWQG